MPYWFDGNNLIGQPASAAQEDPQTRSAFLSLLSGLAGSRGGRFLVFFDGDGRDGRMPPRGVQVRYSAPTSADEAILRALRATRTPSEVIVVSNDRGLRVRCLDEGAKTVTWEEFCVKARPGPMPPGVEKAREEPVRVEEWLDYFGLNKENLD
jgi:hypothetical protein